jgi:large subunit ribosomal protein L30
MKKRIIVIRIRGSVNVNRYIADTLEMLKLKKVNNAVIIDDRETYRGMLQKVKDYVTWGEIDAADVSLILKKRGDLEGGGKLSDDYVKKNTPYKSIDDVSKAIAEFKAEPSVIPGLKGVFRLHPPRKGHRGIKKSYSIGGSLGNRGGEIKKLIHQMR